MSWLCIALPFSRNVTVSDWIKDFIASLVSFILDFLDPTPNHLSVFDSSFSRLFHRSPLHCALVVCTLCV